MDERERQASLLEAIKQDRRVRVIGELSGGRVLIEIDVAIIEPHPLLRQLRSDHNFDIKLLQASIEKTGKDTLYQVSLYAEQLNGDLHYYCGDGAQRLAALEGSGVKRTVAQVVLRWRDAKDAMQDCLSANMARYKWTDGDIISVIRTNELSRIVLMEVTGFKESTIDRYEAIAPHKWLTDLVEENCVGYSKAATWIKACKDNKEKVEALKNTLATKYDKAKQYADHYLNEEKRSKLTGKDRKKKEVSHWFKQDAEIDEIGSMLENKNAVFRDPTGKPWIKLDSSTKKVLATIGPADEWKTNLALNNFFGRDVEDIPLESFEKVIAQWPMIGEWIVKHRDRLRNQDYWDKNPMPGVGPSVEEEETTPTINQVPDSENVESGEPDSDDNR